MVGRTTALREVMTSRGAAWISKPIRHRQLIEAFPWMIIVQSAYSVSTCFVDVHSRGKTIFHLGCFVQSGQERNSDRS
jgi:hypothetical protein